MSQAGKVLHLYVEVRSVAEEEGKGLGRGDDGTGHLMLQCPDVLPHSQKSSTHSSPNRSPDLSPVTQHHTGGGKPSLPPSKSSSRHSVSFQLQNPDATGSPTQFHRQDVLYDSFDQLLQVLAPGTTSPGQHGSLGRSEPFPYQGRVLISPSSTSSGRLTVPSTPSSNRRSYEVPGVEGEEGKTSVVTFGYIEKANVHSMVSGRTSVCQSDLDNPLKRKDGQLLPAHLRKRLSDPVWYNGQPVQDDLYPNHPYASRKQSPRGSPYLQKATLDAVPTDASYRALEAFGSPEIRRRFDGHGPENCSPTLPRHYQSPRCRSLGGSPVLPRSTHTLPSKAQLLELDRGLCRYSLNGLPRSPASDHLCAHTGYSSHSVAPTSTLRSHGLPQSQQRPWVGDESPRLSSKFHPPLPAGKPTDIQHEIPASIFPTSNPLRTGYQTCGNSQHSVNSSYNANMTNTSHNTTDSMQHSANDNLNLSSKSHYKPSHCSSRTSDAVSPTNGRRSVSPSSNAEVACKLALEATKLSTVFAGRRTPSPISSQAELLRSESPKIEGSSLRESQPYPNLQRQNSPEPLQADYQNHRWETGRPTTQTRPGRVSPLLSHTGLFPPASPALPARLHRSAASQSPVLDPRQQRSSSPSKDMSNLHRYQPPQYTGDRKSPGMEHRQYDHLFDRSPRDSPELSRSLLSSQNTEALPVIWNSRCQEWRETGPIQDRDKLSEEDYRQSTSRVYTPGKEENHRKDGEDKAVRTSVQGNQRLVVGVLKDHREDVHDHSGATGMSSQSSSGVTGSMGDSSQLDRNDSLFPETSSLSSHDTADTGSGIQVGWTGGG
ncbi:uncharacterized protein LOC120796560 [Xiphias gladius]|uniref:uncharacterized protein LOC120796560 n=1 Tax=Xiphias gladius TaxID=8245 RepID=UPI001A99819B|nr:uncharacterized protein LOC120796560 [Xiphias gladius]